MRVLVLGFTFKENCADVRETRVFPLIEGLRLKGFCVDVCDPVAPPEQAKKLYNIQIISSLQKALRQEYDVVVFAVAHDAFLEITKAQLKNALVVDIKGVAPRADWNF